MLPPIHKKSALAGRHPDRGIHSELMCIPTEAVIADKGYDSDGLVATIEAAGAEAIIPPRSNRKTQRTVDWHRYKARNLVERFFNRLK